MIGRIREVLRLETQRRAASVGVPGLALNGAVEEVRGVQLHSRLRREHFENAPALRLVDRRCERKRIALLVQYEVVVVAAAEADLLVVGIDPFTDLVRLAEIERCSFDAL